MVKFRFRALILSFSSILLFVSPALFAEDSESKTSYGLSVFRQTSTLRPFEYDRFEPFTDKGRLNGTTETHYPFLFWYEFSNRMVLEFAASKWQVTDGHYRAVQTLPSGIYDYTSGIGDIDRSQESLQLLRSYDIWGIKLSPGIGLRHLRRQVTYGGASTAHHEDWNALMLQGTLRFDIPLPGALSLQLDSTGYIGQGRFRPGPYAWTTSDWQYGEVRLSDDRVGQASGYEWNAAFYYRLNDHVRLSLGYGVTQDYRYLWNQPFLTMYWSPTQPLTATLYDEYSFATDIIRERTTSYSLGLHVQI